MRRPLAFKLMLAFGVSSVAFAQDEADDRIDRSVLPIAPKPFSGKVAHTAKEATPDWPHAVRPPKGAPNVLLVMTDDVGFGASSTFGGPVPTPALDRLAQSGVRFANFHTTAMCSPSRAALLTGRNPHTVGAGAITDVASGYPGYSSVFPRNATTIARILRDNGYSTAHFGKHHNIPTWENNLAGSFNQWPSGLGFDYSYGFMIGSTDQWHPRLFRNNVSVDEPLAEGEILDAALSRDAVRWVHQQRANAPDKPFFLYLAPGTAHAPHQAPTEWIGRFKGQFDQGWDRLRVETFQRQKRLGILPPGTQLTARPVALPAWSSVKPEEQRLFARHMEVFAAMLAHQDAQFGKLLDELERMGELDNTLVIFIEGDNGASAEAGRDGTQNEVGHYGNGVHGIPDDIPAAIEAMGDDRTQSSYPAQWAWALSTPFQWYKQVASHFGGTTNGLVVSWRGRIRDPGEVRRQFSFITDIAPTILEASRIPAPTTVDGVTQQPLAGTSLLYALQDPKAAERHNQQYFEMFANRAMYKDGWLASTTPRRMPWQFADIGGNPETDYVWELYDLKNDFSQSRNLARVRPEKLEELKALWAQEAERNQVYPLDDRTDSSRRLAARRAYDAGRTKFDYWGKDISVAENVAPSFAGPSFKVTARITPSGTEDTGVILARGSWFGGWSLFLEKGHVVALQSRSTAAEDQFSMRSRQALAAQPTTVTFTYTRDDAEPFGGGTMCVAIDQGTAECGRFPRTIVRPAGQGETFDIGKDTGTPVTDRYAGLGRFPGTIAKVTVELPQPKQ